jgi:outer membrane immunogenic protein
MRKLLLLTASAVALAAGSAGAADMRMPVKAPPVYKPACAQFGGGYIGLNGGWAWHDWTWVDRDAWVDNFNDDWALGTVAHTRNGGTAGVQAGYNVQRNCTVFGFEVDANWVGISNTKTYSPTADPDGTVLTLQDRLRWYATARTRTGLIVDDLMLFVTGGIAYANVKHDFTISQFDGFETFGAKRSRWGWVGGVGAEWAWSDNVSIKSEVLYIRFSEITTSVFSEAGDQTVRFDHQDSMWVSRMGINVRWGAPLYSKY